MKSKTLFFSGTLNINALKTFLLLMTFLTACDDNIQIERGGEFNLTILPYRQTISKGETRELFFQIQTESEWSGTVYTVRYSQTEGEGFLRTSDGRTLRENRESILSDKSFTLLYTSAADSDHSLTVTVSDNSGHSQSIKIELGKK